MSNQYDKLHAKEVAGRMAEGVILDVRTPAEFEESRVEGAVLLPLTSLDPEKARALAAGDKTLYVMCRSGGRAARAAEQLRAAGLERVCLVEGGMLAWESAGLPVKRGERKVIPIERQARIVMGSIALAGAVLGFFVNPAWTGLSAFAGAGLIFSGITDWCGLGLLLARAPWNQGSCDCCCSGRRAEGN